MSTPFFDVPLIQQGLQECAQACAAQILQFYGVKKSLEEIKKEVPVYNNNEGIPLGTSVGHIATYMIQQGFKSTMHVTDIQIFDRKWDTLSSKELVENLQQRKKFIKHPIYTKEILDTIFDGYISFLHAGGKILFPIIDEKYLVTLLEKGPIYAIASYNFLNTVSKYKFIEEKNKYKEDSIEGNTSTHAISIAGYKENKFYIVDPDYDFGGKKWIDAGLLIASLYVAQTDYDNLVITLEK